MIITNPTRSSGASPSSNPIGISTTSSNDLPRPRAVPRYSSSLPRTAFTPPSAALPISSSSKQKVVKPPHPFFTRAQSVPLPPPSARPRLVAHYSSTSESAKTESQQSDSTWESYSDRWATRDGEIELLAEEFGGLGSAQNQTSLSRTKEVPIEAIERIEAVETIESLSVRSRPPLASAQILPVRRAPAPVYPPKANAVTTIRLPKPLPQPSNLEPFDHRTFTPQNRPRVIYTTNESEADDLLSCLRGPVLGFDLEWPVSGKYRAAGPDGRMVEKRIGMRWTGERWGFEQARTALMQFCDEKLIVLVHLRDMASESNPILSFT